MTITRMCLMLRSFLFLFLFFGLCQYMKIANGLNPSAREEKIQCIEKERQALLMVKQSLIDDYGHLSSWRNEGGKKDCCLWRGVRCSNRTRHVIMLDLSKPFIYPLRGVIPTTVGSLLSIEAINLRNNSFSGDLPSSLKNCNQLAFLDLSQNTFSGSIPAWIGENLLSLIFLSLQANEFYGRIPSNLCQLANIRILDLSQNTLSGSIPLCLNNLTAMVQKADPNDIIEQHYNSARQDISFTGGYYIAKAWVGWKGKKYEYERSLGLFRIIDLASNKLDGEIPDEITRLSELVALNLSGNNLIGFIPENIGQLKQLESLDLSNNQLSGRIPNGMADLNFVSYLNLSYNSLSGKIPLGTQLQSLDASAFIGNQALCGPPIIQECPKNDMFQAQPPEQERDEFNRWFYVGMGIGFFMAFWGVFGTLLLKRSWRHAYFRLLDSWTDSLYVAFMLWSARLERKFQS